MNERVYFTVLIYLKPGKEALFHKYERQAARVMERHNGRFEQIIKPTTVSGDLPLPDEIHILSFATADGFTRATYLDSFKNLQQGFTVNASGDDNAPIRLAPKVVLMNANTAIWKAAKKLSPSAGKIPNGP